MNTQTADAATRARILEILSLDDENRISVEISKNDGHFTDAYCESDSCLHRSAPAAVSVTYSVRDYEDGGYAVTEEALCGTCAPDSLSFLLISDRVSDRDEIRVVVSYWWLRYVHPDAA